MDVPRTHQVGDPLLPGGCFQQALRCWRRRGPHFVVTNRGWQRYSHLLEAARGRAGHVPRTQGSSKASLASAAPSASYVGRDLLTLAPETVITPRVAGPQRDARRAQTSACSLCPGQRGPKGRDWETLEIRGAGVRGKVTQSLTSSFLSHSRVCPRSGVGSPAVFISVSLRRP